MSAKPVALFALLAAAAGVYVFTNRPESAVHVAIAKNDLARVNALLDRQPDLLESRGRNGRTPLLLAVEMNRIEVFHALLRRGADANARTDDDANALHLAAEHDLQVAAKTLLQYGASMEAKDRVGRTPGDVAAERHNWSIAQLLGGPAPSPVDVQTSHRSIGPQSVAVATVSMDPN